MHHGIWHRVHVREAFRSAQNNLEPDLERECFALVQVCKVAAACKLDDHADLRERSFFLKPSKEADDVRMA